MLEVLIYLFQNYLNTPSQESNAPLHFRQDDVAQELSEAGFNSLDIAGAFDWYDELNKLAKQPYQQYLSNPCSVRVFTEQERERIDAESFSFLHFLGQAGVIKPAERDLIFDRAMALKQKDITIEEIRWITMMVLWNDTRKKDYLFVEDAVFNPKGLTLQ